MQHTYRGRRSFDARIAEIEMRDRDYMRDFSAYDLGHPSRDIVSYTAFLIDGWWREIFCLLLYFSQMTARWWWMLPNLTARPPTSWPTRVWPTSSAISTSRQKLIFSKAPTWSTHLLRKRKLRVVTGHSGIEICTNVESRARNRVILRKRTCYQMSIRSTIVRNSDKTMVKCTTITFLLRTWFNDGAGIGAAMFLLHIESQRHCTGCVVAFLWCKRWCSHSSLCHRDAHPQPWKIQLPPFDTKRKETSGHFLKIPSPPSPVEKVRARTLMWTIPNRLSFLARLQVINLV